MNKFYFELALFFEKDYDVFELEKVLGQSAARIVPYKNARETTQPKTAKIFFRSSEIEGIYSDDLFEKYVSKLAADGNLATLQNILQINSGKAYFNIVFTDIQETPALSFKASTLSIIANIRADIDISF